MAGGIGSTRLAPMAPVPSYSVVPPVAMQLAQAYQQAPVQAAEDQAKIAQAKATAATAMPDAQAKQLQSDQAIMARLAPIISAGTGPLPSTLTATISPVLKRLGFDMPLDEQGQPDRAKLLEILAPAKPWAQWSDDDVKKALAIDPKFRRLPADAPPEMKTHPTQVTMTSVEENQLYERLAANERRLGQAGYTPEMFLSDVQSAKKRLEDAGMSTAALDPYLSKDGTQLNESIRDHYIGGKTQSEIDHLTQLGIHLASEDTYRTDSLGERRREFDEGLKFKREEADKKYKIELQRVNNANNNLAARWASIQNSRDRLDLENNQYARTIYKNIIDEAGSDLDKARSQMRTTIGTLTQMANNPKLMKTQQYQDLLTQATDLKKFIDEKGPEIDAERAAAKKSLHALYESVTGHKAAGGGDGGTAPPPEGTRASNGVTTLIFKSGKWVDEKTGLPYVAR